jgi:streptogramin lyase
MKQKSLGSRQAAKSAKQGTAFALLLISRDLFSLLAAIFAFTCVAWVQGAEPPGTITTLAGTGAAGYSGDNGPAAQAQLGNPYGLVRGPDGALYVCEVDNQVIRRITPDATITTVAGTGRRGYSGDGGPASRAELNEPYEVRFDRAGNMVFVEMKNHLVRRVDAKTRIVTTIAGTGKPGFSGDGGPATKALLNQPHSIQLDSADNLYICDIANHRIRKVEAKSGVISTFAGTGGKTATLDGASIAGTPLYGPRALDFDAQGNLWLALREGNAVYKLDLKAGTLHHIAGTGKKGFTGNGGPAREATLSGPKGLALGPDGNVYLADTESHSIRKIDVKKGTIELIAGTGERGDGPDGDPLKCKMARPHGVFVDRDGTILVGDSEAHRVRVLRP